MKNVFNKESQQCKMSWGDSDIQFCKFNGGGINNQQRMLLKEGIVVVFW